MTALDTDFCPKFFVIDYSKLLNDACSSFINNHNSDFIVDKSFIDNIFVYAGTKSVVTIKKEFLQYIEKYIFEYIENCNAKFPNLKIKKFIVIKSCNPSSNILKNDFNSLIKNQFEMVENDIKIDFLFFEKIWNTIFDKKFKKISEKILNSDVFYLKHANLNFLQLKNIFERTIGKFVDEYQITKPCLIDMNTHTNFTVDSEHEKERKIVISEVKSFLKKVILAENDT